MNLPAQRVLANIEKGKLAPGYLLLGQEVYWRDRIWAALRRALGMEGTEALVEFDLRQGSVDAALEKARERNLWAPRQLLLVRNAHGLSATKGLPSVKAYFEDSSPFTVLVFEMMDVDLVTEDWREKEKAKARLEAWEGICEVALLAAPDLAECMELVRQECAARGRKISAQAAESVAAMLERDLGRIVMEVEKLCLHNPEGGEITEEEVYSVVGSRAAPTGLSLTEAIGSGDARKAFEAVAEAMRGGAYLPLVISELARTLRQLLLLQESNTRDPRQAAKVLWS
ncbi:MAG TPA: DNA polymerase III subunit delta, partial [Terriglobia bacterium]